MHNITLRSVFIQVIIFGVIVVPLLNWFAVPAFSLKSFVLCFLVVVTVEHFAQSLRNRTQKADTNAQVRD